MIPVMLAEPGTFALLSVGILILAFLVMAMIVAIIFITSRTKKNKNSEPTPPIAPATQVIQRPCPQCGATLQPDVPEGLCPACLLQRGIATEGGGPPGSPPFVPPTIPELAKLFPQLEILELIGKGGMGAVYKARQPALDRFVALKILAPRSGGDLDFAGRFSREARALARLNHPNIVGVFDFGEMSGHRPDATPLHYFIMEFVDGPNLRQAGRLSPRVAMEIIPQICTALQFAHDEGIVHRDIKPENVLLDKKGRVKIADFGLAKILGQEAKDFRLTGANDIMGTPHYMAPEQVERPQDVDHRADIYSLGVVFYEMLTGELPLGKFQSPSQKVQVDVRLDEVVLRALEKEPARRYQRASEVKTDLETIAKKSPGVGSRRRSVLATWLWLCLLGAVLVLGGVGTVILSRWNVAKASRAIAGAAVPQSDSTEAITGWLRAGSHPQEYEMALDRKTTHSGKASAYLKSRVPEPAGFGTLMQLFKADPYRGQRVRLSGFVQSKDVRSWAGLWVRVDGPDNQVLSFDNMQDRAIKGTADWTRYEVVVDVPAAGQAVAMGLLLAGAGQVWMDDLKFEVVGTEIPATGGKPGDRMPPTPQLNFSTQPKPR